jgi:uncharacterized FAD-dependent dehydrogenase
MSQVLEFKLSFDADLKAYVASHYPLVKNFRILSESLDARGAPRGKKPLVHYQIEVIYEGEDFQVERRVFAPLAQNLQESIRPVIIGAGPGGLFAALRMVESGLRPIVIERGERAQKRMLHIARHWRYGELNPESNVCYGEGGAGLYSDGKLITRIKSDWVKWVMRKLVDFGAPEEIAHLSNPHLGSNKIRAIISKISDYLVSRGADILYNTRVDEILTNESDAEKKVVGVKLHTGEIIDTEFVILATGHSAKEMYQHLEEINVAMKPKDFAVGVRVEHSREHIDKISHGPYADSPLLGAARYKLTFHDLASNKGTYSFCMCPGGYVLASSTDQEGIVVNGMSNYARNSRWSNSALVVTVQAGVDFPADEILAGLKFQESIEKKAYELSKMKASGRELPCMTMGEFLKGSLSDKELPVSSTPSGLFKQDLKDLFPTFILEHLKQALKDFNHKMPGFIHEDALLIAPETRTSAPVTVLRDKNTLESLSHQGLYPCGEGAGYAGGITSAAVDGIKIAESIINKLFSL